MTTPGCIPHRLSLFTVENKIMALRGIKGLLTVSKYNWQKGGNDER